MIDSSDDEDEGQTGPMQEKTPPAKPAQASKNSAPAKDAQNGEGQSGAPLSRFGFFDEDEEMDDDMGSDQTGNCQGQSYN